MVRPTMKFIATTKDKLDSIPIIAGSLIFVRDDRAIYLDVTDSQRTIYQSVITITSEEERRTMIAPIDGFYYVQKENTLWSYFNSLWVEVIGKNPNIVFTEEMPLIGTENIIYVNNHILYNWNKDKQEYEKLHAEMDWEE